MTILNTCMCAAFPYHYILRINIFSIPDLKHRNYPPTWVFASTEKYALEQAWKTLSQREAHIRGGPSWTPTRGSQIEHSNSSHNCKHSWLASPAEASLLMDNKARCVWATSQHVFLRNTLQRVKSLGPLVTFRGGFPSDEKGGKRPPGEMHTPLVLPAFQKVEEILNERQSQ